MRHVLDGLPNTIRDVLRLRYGRVADCAVCNVHLTVAACSDAGYCDAT